MARATPMPNSTKSKSSSSTHSKKQGAAKSATKTASKPSTPSKHATGSSATTSLAPSSLEDELSELRAQVKTLLAKQAADGRNGNSSNSGNSSSTSGDKQLTKHDKKKAKVIKKPKGCAGDDWNLREKMRLSEADELYKAIRLTVRRCVDAVGLDEMLLLRDQDRVKLGKVCLAARERQPYLKRFKSDWATLEFVKMLLKNRRALNRRRASRLEHEDSGTNDSDANGGSDSEQPNGPGERGESDDGGCDSDDN